MAKLNISSEGMGKSPASTTAAAGGERRTSQRTTRSTSRQIRETVGHEADTSSETKNNKGPGMWTPGKLSLVNKQKLIILTDQGIRFG